MTNLGDESEPTLCEACHEPIGEGEPFTCMTWTTEDGSQPTKTWHFHCYHRNTSGPWKLLEGKV